MCAFSCISPREPDGGMICLILIMTLWEFHERWFSAIYSLAHRAEWSDVTIIFFAELFPLILAAFLLLHILSLRTRERLIRELLFVFGPAFLAAAFSGLVDGVFPFPRPFFYYFDVSPIIRMGDAFGSFPSSHTMFFATLGYALFLHERYWGEWYIAGAVLIGIARVAAGVHWPMDIIVGFALGLLFAQVAHALEMRIYGESYRQKVAAVPHSGP